MDAQLLRGDAVRRVLKADAIVGESPLWHAAERRLYWVDIQGKKVHRFDPATGVNETFPVPDIVTCLAFRRAGGLLLTMRKNLATFDPDTNRFERGRLVEQDRPGNRFNDGRCDPAGRFWAGTMGDPDWAAPVGGLYRLDVDGSLHLMQSHVKCGNGTAWSPDGRTMYFTESFRHAIFAYDFDAGAGAISNRRVFHQMREDSGGFPDGLTVDADGFVWSNQVGLGRVVRLDPEGKIERIVQLPVPRATGCTFGGPDLRTLYITTARETMTPQQLADFPESGSLFAIDLPIQGLPATAYGRM